MKLVTFVHEGQYRLGALLSIESHERVYDLNRLEPRTASRHSDLH